MQGEGTRAKPPSVPKTPATFLFRFLFVLQPCSFLKQYRQTRVCSGAALVSNPEQQHKLVGPGQAKRMAMMRADDDKGPVLLALILQHCQLCQRWKLQLLCTVLEVSHASSWAVQKSACTVNVDARDLGDEDASSLAAWLSRYAFLVSQLSVRPRIGRDHSTERSARHQHHQAAAQHRPTGCICQPSPGPTPRPFLCCEPLRHPRS